MFLRGTSTGREEWIAEKGKHYFIITAHEILKGSEDLVCF